MIVNEINIAEVEAWCERLYVCQDPEERRKIDGMVEVLSKPEHIQTNKKLLDSSKSPYCQFLASSSLLRIITDHSTDANFRLDMKIYFLEYLKNVSTKVAPFVLNAIIQLLCRIVKMGWFDDSAQRSIIEDCKKLLNAGSIELYYLGIKILVGLVKEMNTFPKRYGKLYTLQRKTATSFRDEELLQVFRLSKELLKQMNEFHDKIKEEGLNLLTSCIQFDFMNYVDSSSDEPEIIQIPSAWRSEIEDSTILDLLLHYYSAVQSPSNPLLNLILQAFVCFASVRKSIFSGEDSKQMYVSKLVNISLEILKNKHGIQEHSNYNEYCKLLSQIKTNYNLADLSNDEKFDEWINAIYNFTITSFKSWQWVASSMVYLLKLWSRIATSINYLKNKDPEVIRARAPSVIEGFVNSKLENITSMIQNGSISDDSIENDGALQEQMDAIPSLFRFNYDVSCQIILKRIDPLIQHLQHHMNIQSQNEMELKLIEGQLTLMTHIISSVIGGRSSRSIEEEDAKDAELSAQVFTLIKISENDYYAQRNNQLTKQQLEIAVIKFLHTFRRAFIGEQITINSKVYESLNKKIGLKDSLQVIDGMIVKISTNLHVYACNENIIKTTMELFHMLATSSVNQAKLIKLESVRTIIRSHSNFRFLRESVNMKNRINYYKILTKLAFAENNPEAFRAFKIPLQQNIEALEKVNDLNTFNLNTYKSTIVSLFRDLKGVMLGTMTRKAYGYILNWFNPNFFKFTIKCLQEYSLVSEVAIPILQFISELINNFGSRINFDNSSPNGIYLFKFLSESVCTYGNILMTQANVDNIYKDRYKGIWLSLLITARAFSGSYVNFSTFELYGDPALNNMINICMKMAMSVPLHEILAYKKYAMAYYSLMDVLFTDHMNLIAKRNIENFQYLISSLEIGLKALETSIASQCAVAIDSMAAFYFNHVINHCDLEESKPGAQGLADHIRRLPHAFPSMLKTLLDIVFYEDSPILWSLSRPILSIIVINFEWYDSLKNDLINSRPMERRSQVNDSFNKLMKDVSHNLEPRNRDQFSQNLTHARNHFRA